MLPGMLPWIYMPERAAESTSSWAQRQQASDLAWITDNLRVPWPDAQKGYEEHGPGAIVVDITQRPASEGHSFGYFHQAFLEKTRDEDTQRIVREYDQSWKMVAVLLKTHDRTSTYRVAALRGEPTKKRHCAFASASGWLSSCSTFHPATSGLITWIAYLSVKRHSGRNASSDRVLLPLLGNLELLV